MALQDSKPAVLVDVGEGVLGVEIAGFLGAEGVGEQFNEQILGTAAGGGAVGRHGGHLISFALAVQPAGPLLKIPQFYQRDGALTVFLQFPAMLPDQLAGPVVFL